MATPRVETLALDCRALWGAEVELLSGVDAWRLGARPMA